MNSIGRESTGPIGPSEKRRPEGKNLARLVMEAIAVLHAEGYGLLKLSCYVKEGLGAWRYFVFGSDSFPENVWVWPGAKVVGSIPNDPALVGDTAQEIAGSIHAQYQEILDAAHGEDDTYVNWYRKILAAFPAGILEMESPGKVAIIGHGKIAVPSLKVWKAPRPSEEEMEAQRRENDRKSIKRFFEWEAEQRRDPKNRWL